jgi:hypothetical protein
MESYQPIHTEITFHTYLGFSFQKRGALIYWCKPPSSTIQIFNTEFEKLLLLEPDGLTTDKCIIFSITQA